MFALRIFLICAFVWQINAHHPKCFNSNEVYSECRGHCERTCENRHPVCPLICIPGCVCAKGYLRDTYSGKCVLPKDCPKREVCGKYEYWSACGTACPLTCDNYKNPPKTCSAVCVNGCFCHKPYVRDTKNNRCVLPCHCPKRCHH